MSVDENRTDRAGRKRRVAYLTNMLLDWETRQPRFGGGERYCITLGSLLRDLGFEVTFFQAGNSAFEGDYFGFKVIAIPPGAQVSEFQPGICDEFYRMSQEYDHVIHNIPTYASGLLRDDALVICHSVWFDHGNFKPPIEFRTPQWFEQLYLAFSRPQRVVTVDTNIINVIRALWPELTARMTYIPSYVDTDIFSPPKRREHHQPTILFPRRSEYTRGSQLLEPILKNVPHDCRVMWVGDGEPEETARIKSLAELDRRLQFFTASFEEMPSFYKLADICVIPAVASEGTCLASLEALASGCAVVCTNIGGLANIFQPDVNGLMTDADPEQIAAAINRLIEDPNERARFQKVGRETALHFSLSVWRQRWNALLGELGWIDSPTPKSTTPAKGVPQRYYDSLKIHPDIVPEDHRYIPGESTSNDLRRYDVICFSIIDWEFRYQRPQQIMSQFAERGHRVFCIRKNRFNPQGARPRTTVTEIKHNIFDVTVAAANPELNIYSDVLKGADVDELIASIDEIRNEYGIKSAVAYVMIASWSGVAISARERWGWKIIYDCMDDWEDFPGIAQALIEAERGLVTASDLTVTTSQLLYDKWSPLARRVRLVRNGVDYEFYRDQLKPNNLLSGIKHPVVGYYGAIAPWFDIDLMCATAAKRPEYTFVLIGGVFDVDVSCLEALPNVQLLGQQPYEHMPEYLYHFDVCIIPFLVNSITAATNPVKLYEYFSGGKPVVCVSLPEIERYHELVYSADGPDDFVAKLDQAVRERDPDLAGRRKRVAEEQTWALRYEEIGSGLNANPEASIVTVTHNDLAYTKLCLESLIRNTSDPGIEIIVVDNNSYDDTVKYLRDLAQQFPQIRLIENKIDEGFIRGLNRGAEHAAGAHLILIKPDTVFPVGWLSGLTRHLQNPRVGLCCPATNYLGSEAGESVTYETPAEMAEYIRQRDVVVQPLESRHLTLFCAGIRREVFNQVGPLDAQIGEDRYEDEYARRLRDHGYEIVSASDAFVHYFGRTAGTHSKLLGRERLMKIRLKASEDDRAELAAAAAELRCATSRLTADLRNTLLERDTAIEEIQGLSRKAMERDVQIELLSRQLNEHVETEKSLNELVEKEAEERRLLSSRLAETEESVRLLSLQVAREQGSARILSDQLSSKDYELKKITSSLGWRILNRYGRIKYRYLLPVYKLLGLPPYDKKRGMGVPISQPPFVQSYEPGQSGDPASVLDDNEFAVVHVTATQTDEEPYKPGQSNTCDVICFPIIDWDFRFQRPQQLMSRFAAAGHRVFYLSQAIHSVGEPYVIQTKGKAIYEVSLRGPALNVYSDVLDRNACAELFSSLDALRRDLSIGAAAAFVQLPFWGPLAKRVRDEFAWPTIYDCMDHHAGFSTNRDIMLDQEEDLLRSADLIVVSSKFLEEKAKQSNSNVVVARNACDFEHFAVSSSRNNGRPVVGYYGAIADWFDSDLVADLAESRPDWDFVLVGSTFSADISRLSKLANVVLAGEKHYSEIPDWLKKFDVALIPFKRSPLTEATNPVKAYEILAAGKPLVSVPIPEVAALAPLVRLASTAREFESEIISALNEEVPELAERRRTFAREHTWEKRFEFLAPKVRDAFPKASIIIVTFNNLDFNRRCLESLYSRTEWPNFEVVVVDNASTDGTPEYLKEAEATFPNLRVILNDANLGFARANNIGLKQASGKYLVLLNNDTVLARGWLSAMIRHLNADPKIGLIGPVTNEIGNEAKIPVGYTLLEDMPRWAANYVRENDNQLFEIPMLAMFCVVIRRETLERVGLLDESFEIGMFEDDDYARRLKQEDYRLVCARDSFIHHVGRGSFKLIDQDRYTEIFQKNRRTYEQKWGSWKPHMDEEARRQIPGLVEQLRRIVTRSGAEPGRIVVFLPSTGWNTPLAQRPQHVARELARQGFLVFFDCSGSVIDQVQAFHEVESNLWLYKGPVDVLETLDRPVLWTLPYNAPQVDRWKEARIVYDFSDDLSAFPYRENELRKNHEKMLQRADLVLCVAQNLIDQVNPSRPDAIYAPNAVEYELFASLTESDPSDLDARFRQLIENGRPTVGYYGAIASWLDIDLLKEVAQLRTDWNFVLIGERLPDAPSMKPLEDSQNILMLRPQPYKMLPHYLSHFTTAMIPFKINRITEATSPIELYEYLAGGKPVISTPTPECQAIGEVLVVKNAREFSTALETSKQLSQDPQYQNKARSRARENSWTARVKMTVEELSARLERKSIREGASHNA